jgi:deazaflavin-dependent oxidoreductase (nitroreductase family)
MNTGRLTGASVAAEIVPKQYRLGLLRRAVNAVAKPVLRLGLGPRQTYLLTVPGRSSGRLYTTPVSLLENEQGRWLVAPYGVTSWVKNARAAGEVELRRGARVERLALAELPAEEAVPILRQYHRRARVTHPFFDVTPQSPDAAWAAEAPHHPVFRLCDE